MQRRAVLALGVTGALAAGTAPAAQATTYGSGAGADYRTYSRALSKDSVWDSAPVWQLGDSIARADGPDLARQLYERHGATLAVDNWAARPTAPAVDELVTRVARHGLPRVVVMATGTNDVFDPPVMAAQLDRVAALVAGRAQVVWVDVYAARWSLGWAQRESDQRNSAWVSIQIAAAAGRHGFHVVPWFATLSANPGYRLSRWLSDGVHTTSLGREARNSLILGALGRTLAAAPADARPLAPAHRS